MPYSLLRSQNGGAFQRVPDMQGRTLIRHLSGYFFMSTDSSRQFLYNIQTANSLTQKYDSFKLNAIDSVVLLKKSASTDWEYVNGNLIKPVCNALGEALENVFYLPGSGGSFILKYKKDSVSFAGMTCGSSSQTRKFKILKNCQILPVCRKNDKMYFIQYKAGDSCFLLSSYINLSGNIQNDTVKMDMAIGNISLCPVNTPGYHWPQRFLAIIHSTSINSNSAFLFYLLGSRLNKKPIHTFISL